MFIRLTRDVCEVFREMKFPPLHILTVFCPYAEFKAVRDKQCKNAMQRSDVKCSEQDFSHQPRDEFVTETQKKKTCLWKSFHRTLSTEQG